MFSDKLLKQFSKSSILILIIIAAVGTGLSMLSYQYSTASANQILELASHEVRSTTEIQAQDISSVLANKVDTISTNLEVMAHTHAIQSQDIQNAIPLFTAARESTADLASSYFWVDSDGKLLWADSFTNKTIEQQYNGGDRSNRDYYLKPRETLMPYYSTIIESIDGIPRLYVGYPIIENGPNDAGVALSDGDEGNSFKGVVAAAINLDTLGEYVKAQLRTNSASETGLLDRNGLVLYSSATPQYAGKNIFGPEIQSIIPFDVKEPFNRFIRDSLTGDSGVGDVTSQGITSTIAYRPVTVRGNEFAILYVVTPHQFAGNVFALVEQQRALNTAIIIAIGVIAAGVAGVMLIWNRRLTEVVAVRTSDLKLSNESLLESNRQLQVANERLKVHDKMQTEFVNIAAHELRTPIQPILSMAEVAEMENKSINSETNVLMNGEIRLPREDFEMILRNARRLERLSSDILDVARIESQSLKLNTEKFDINEKIRAVMRDMTGGAEANSRDIVFEPENGKLVVNADKTRIYEVLSNLLRNAIKFTTEDGIVTITAKKQGNEAVITLKDTGSGIDPEIMPKLFSKFATKSTSGTGLGLYISKSIIEAHGGKIWAANNPDSKGAAFSFSLKLHTSEGV